MCKEEEATVMANILHVQQSDWKDLKVSSKPVFIDFWAEWCSPCRMLGPTFEDLAKSYGDEITFAKVNVDELPELADEFGIRSIPTLLLLRDGNVVERFVGLRPRQELARALDQYATVSEVDKRGGNHSGEAPSL
jgi:thioredoxin